VDVVGCGGTVGEVVTIARGKVGRGCRGWQEHGKLGIGDVRWRAVSSARTWPREGGGQRGGAEWPWATADGLDGHRDGLGRAPVTGQRSAVRARARARFERLSLGQHLFLRRGPGGASGRGASRVSEVARLCFWSDQRGQMAAFRLRLTQAPQRAP
jgi:hypothetical protein